MSVGAGIDPNDLDLNDLGGIRATYHQGMIAEAVEMLDSLDMAGLEWHLKESLRRYLVDKMETGGYLRGCLENDFQRAVALAHPALTLHQLKLVAQLLNSGFPAIAWGSKENVAAWLQMEAT